MNPIPLMKTGFSKFSSPQFASHFESSCHQSFPMNLWELQAAMLLEVAEVEVYSLAVAAEEEVSDDHDPMNFASSSPQ